MPLYQKVGIQQNEQCRKNVKKGNFYSGLEHLFYELFLFSINRITKSDTKRAEIVEIMTITDRTGYDFLSATTGF
jgi:hypothetical protein